MTDTQTKPGLKEPKNPSDVALDTEESSRIDVCIQENSFQQRLVHVYIRYSGIDIKALLSGAESLESRIFDGIKTEELRIRFIDLASSLKPIVDLRREDGTYLLEYGLPHKEEVYDYIRKLR